MPGSVTRSGNYSIGDQEAAAHLPCIAFYSPLGTTLPMAPLSWYFMSGMGHSIRLRHEKHASWKANCSTQPPQTNHGTTHNERCPGKVSEGFGQRVHHAFPARDAGD